MKTRFANYWSSRKVDSEIVQKELEGFSFLVQ